MFKIINENKLIAGDDVIIIWDLPNAKKQKYYFWEKKSVLFWKNYSPIENSGKTKFRLTNNEVNVRICTFNNLWFKTIHEIKAPVLRLKINNVSEYLIQKQVASEIILKTKINLVSLRFSIAKKEFIHKNLKFYFKNV